jgi:hypothetical protein
MGGIMDETTEIEFKVNEQYKNEKGIFTVISIDKDEMVIRWESGEEISTAIELQRRIQERRMREKLFQEAKHRAAKSGKKAGGKGAVFTGFQPDDFKKSATGTKWRGRGQLGGAVTKRLSDSRLDFNSWAYGHNPEMHWFDIAHRRKEGSEYQAKFFVRVDAQFLYYGFYVVRTGQTDQTEKDWSAFYEWLQHQDNDQMLQKMVDEQQLTVHDRNRPAFGQLLSKDGAWHVEIGEKQASVDMLIAHFESVPAADGIDLEVFRKINKDEAVAREVNIADDIAELFMAIMPLYRAVLKI